MLEIGSLVDGKYEIIREIGHGGMSVVYLAMDTRLNKQWAIKVIKKVKGDPENELKVQSLRNEANLLKKLDHPALVRVVDIFEDSTKVLIVEDYVEGEPLSKYVEIQGAQNQDIVIEWAKQICDVLDYLHTNNPPIVYRDMKPSNIMLRPDNTIRLLDLGTAREYKEYKKADTVQLGTYGYAAPEQIGADGTAGHTDARSDIYALGVTLFVLLTGESPAKLRPIREINPEFYEGLHWLIVKCTEIDPDKRWSSCAEVASILDNLYMFESSRIAKQKSKLNGFIACIALFFSFLLLGFGSFGMYRSALKSSFGDKLATIQREGASDSDVSAAYKTVGKYAEKLTTGDLLDLALAYYTHDRIDSLVRDTFGIGTDNVYAVLKDRFVGESGLSNNIMSSWAALNYNMGLADLSYILSTGNNIGADTYYYFERSKDAYESLPGEGIDSQSYKKSKAFYIISKGLATLTQSTGGAAYGDSTGSSVSDSTKEDFLYLLESGLISDDSLDSYIKLNIYYYVANNRLNNYKNLLSAGISKAQLDEAYAAVYGKKSQEVLNEYEARRSEEVDNAQLQSIINNENHSGGIYELRSQIGDSESSQKKYDAIINDRIRLAAMIANATEE